MQHRDELDAEWRIKSLEAVRDELVERQADVDAEIAQLEGQISLRRRRSHLSSPLEGPATSEIHPSGVVLAMTDNLGGWATVLLPFTLRVTAHDMGICRVEPPEPFTAGQWDSPTSAARLAHW